MGEVAVKGLTEADALELARRGSSETVEVRGRLTSAKILADLIAGFAHHQGGCIIFGYHPRKGKVIGCNQNRLKRRHDAAEAILGQVQISTIYFHKVHGRQLGVIYVPAVDRLIDSPGGLVVRTETVLRAMSKSRIIEVLQRTRTKMSVDEFGTMILRVAQRVEETRDRIRREASWWTKIKEQIVGFVVGSALTALVAFIVTRLR